MALVRFAYASPTIDAVNFLTYVVRDPGPYGRDIRCRRRDDTATFYPHYPLDLQVYYLLTTVYARLGETELARKYAALARTTPIPDQQRDRR